MTEAVLFDLGNTLVHYFERSEFPALLEAAVREVQTYLEMRGLLHVPADVTWQGVRAENYEAEDHRVRPLEGRLARIFRLDPSQTMELMPDICRRFSQPLVARARCYEDTLPVLQQLRSKGLRTALVSNTPWGSPGTLWREELERFGVDKWLDVVVFCTDVGWRKPARPIFELALRRLDADPQHCLFVGDDPRWDLAGAQAMGMDAILIDRGGAPAATAEKRIQSLHDLWDHL
jgi:putative hydrolase of the HAD superfamily